MFLSNLERKKGHFLNFLKYTKQGVLKNPRYLLTERVRNFLESMMLEWI